MPSVKSDAWEWGEGKNHLWNVGAALGGCLHVGHARSERPGQALAVVDGHHPVGLEVALVADQNDRRTGRGFDSLPKD